MCLPSDRRIEAQDLKISNVHTIAQVMNVLLNGLDAQLFLMGLSRKEASDGGLQHGHNVGGGTFGSLSHKHIPEYVGMVLDKVRKNSQPLFLYCLGLLRWINLAQGPRIGLHLVVKGFDA